MPCFSHRTTKGLCCPCTTPCASSTRSVSAMSSAGRRVDACVMWFEPLYPACVAAPRAESGRPRRCAVEGRDGAVEP
eukprot:4837889-Pleurochrysis_carterae.AAC.1